MLQKSVDDQVQYSARSNLMRPEKNPLNLQIGRFFLSMCGGLVGKGTYLLWVEERKESDKWRLKCKLLL